MNTNGIFRGICTTTNDPEHRRRIKLKVPQLMGQQETDWAWPCFPPGWTSGLLDTHSDPDGAHAHSLVRQTPAPGQGVWVLFEAGDINKPVWLGVWD